MPRGGFERDENELGALWKRSGKKGPFYSGQLDLTNVDSSATTLDLICFPVKSDNPKAPVLRILKGNPPPGKGSARSSEGRGSSSASDEDLPF